MGGTKNILEIYLFFRKLTVKLQSCKNEGYMYRTLILDNILMEFLPEKIQVLEAVLFKNLTPFGLVFDLWL